MTPSDGIDTTTADETRISTDDPALESERFRAFDRPDGRIGVRNRLLVLPSVICSHIVADRIADEIPAAVSAPHDHGCAQLGADNDQTERTFLGVGRNPNVSGVLVVGLGCEVVQSEGVAQRFAESGVPVRELSIQAEGGSDRTIERGIDVAGTLASEQSEAETAATLGDLTVGVVSSDVQRSTLETADPLVGEFVQRVVDAGGRAVVAGTERFVPHGDRACEAVADEATRREFEQLLETKRRIPARTAGLQHRAAGRSFDEVSRSWNGLPVRDVLSYGEPATHESDVAIVDAPSRFAEAATGLAAAGAHVIVHGTADGIPSGHPVVPIVKVTGDESTADALAADIDVDATTTGVDDFTETVLEILEGDPSCAERHGLTEFAITRIGPSM
ncbi:altronate dehydratase [Salinadaptatus halalkaliphilus]|uniref:Altronate dehydratase n=1 Tax=Salinadaptatus halalkaliphilus TaxID=2419781 RepID=A0A4S3TNV9_9EURY|nr:UxaA family hydrolase [Salinadaptatus halalkaliphilus]THE64248.1 altronate dehydratase [Salinadaptatus halalkaliphilus]